MNEQGASSPRALSERLWVLRNRVFGSNTYVGLLSEPGKCLVVDPGLDHEALDHLLVQLEIEPVAVFCTHGHFDHIGGAERLRQAFGATLHIHAAEKRTVLTANFTMMLCKVAGRISIPEIDVLAEESGTYLNDPDCVRLLHVPGHSPGSAFVLWKDFVFSGDTLYRDVAGLENFPGEDAERMRASLRRVWNMLPDSNLICPGHGPAGLFVDIKSSNQALIDFLAAASPAGQP